ncbi:MAG: ornithine cyclodeaminase family protein [Dehalococcoidia bacterium]
MPLLLNNDDIRSALSIRDCMEVIEEAFGEMHRGNAGFFDVIDFWVPTSASPDEFYRPRTMIGAVEKTKSYCVRLMSDVLYWPREGANETEEKYCVQRGTYCGLLFLFNTDNGEPLAILQDGYIQHLRVGATAGVAAKYMARTDADLVGMIGSGGMARSYLRAFHVARPLKRVKVYSPTKEHREAYAREMAQELGIEVEAVGDARAAVKGAALVATCTDSMEPILKGDWLEPGMFLVNLRSGAMIEFDKSVFERVDLTVRTSNNLFQRKVLAGAEAAGKSKGWDRLQYISKEEQPTLGQVVAGVVRGRRDDRQITFFDNGGVGLQFAAAAARAYELAKKRGLGRGLPLEWFVQTIRD